jgi:hypothetical protein
MSPILGIYASQVSGHLWAPTGAYESIATTTLGSATSTITFSSIPGTYTHLQVRMIMRNNSNSGGGGEENLQVQINGDTASNYSSHAVLGNGSSAAAWSSLGSTIYPSYGMIPMSNATASVFGTVIVDLLDYANTNKYKTLRFLGGVDKNGSGYAALSSGSWRSTSATTSITFYPLAGSFDTYSSFALYGIR